MRPRGVCLTSLTGLADPYTGEVLCAVPDMGPGEVECAIDAAARAQKEWGQASPESRAQALQEVAAGLRARREEAAALISAEGGKPLSEARAEVDGSVAYFEWFAG